eukprot:TRINITY_DN24619_c0_g1_i1.p1 TRINITY_DN24619_c0_g1~~TRINITY_DN24619_c0_g1_i1.p1  ORF type:complete len:380 (+),score=67.50 TRINITY_DN24619_c0_g1_i1:67-1206(+)
MGPAKVDKMLMKAGLMENPDVLATEMTPVDIVGVQQRDKHCRALEDEAHASIRLGKEPILIAEGSSGSYFIPTSNGEGTIAVFKPRCEEPYGPANPKWGKWCQRMICPSCCFGRSCLVPNTGYLSEAGASVVDAFLGLDIVPETTITSLSSPSLCYKSWERALAKSTKQSLPLKVGSLQQFKCGYEAASSSVSKIQSLGPELQQQFQSQFEKLTILDYITRNTDRGMGNWLIKIEEPSSTEPSSTGSVKIAAIDNGLSFPFKHPDEVRSYPFGWASLKFAQEKYSKSLANQLLPLLTDPLWVESLIESLRVLWKSDPNFRYLTFLKQAALIRGQIFNVVESLSNQETPIQLLNRPLRLMFCGKTKTTKKIPGGACFSCC